MLAKQHLLLGVAVAISSAAVLPLSPSETALWVSLASLCALYPDLDGAGARLSQALPPLSWLTRKLAALAYQLTRAEHDDAKTRIHRGLSHTPVYIIACSLALYALLLSSGHWAWPIAGAFLVGNLAHLLGDAFSLSGLPLLWPLRVRGKRWFDVRAPKLMRFRVGSTFETVWLRGLCYVLIAASVGFYGYERLL